ncbi:MAG: diguanylate cyclase [Sulfurimonas sp.]|jgi:diguanylate cyclase (GGDEF)-like protein/PAS domain S-box-containing protein
MKVSFKYKFILSFLTIEILFISLIVLFNFSSLNSLSKSLIEEKIQTASKLFTELIKVPLIIQDLATIDNAVENFIHLKNIIAVKIVDNQNRVIAHLHNEKYIYEDIFSKDISEVTIDARTFRRSILPIVMDGEVLANTTMVFEITESLNIIKENRNVTLFLVCFEILLSIIIAYAIGFRLTHALNILISSAEKIAENDQTDIPDVGSEGDEIAILSDTLHIMQHKIADRNHNLDDLIKEMQKYIKLVDENVMISRTDINGVTTSVSQAFCKITGYESHELLGKEFNILRDENMPSAIYKDMWNTIQSGNVWQGEIKNRAKDGHYYWIEASIYPDYNDEGEIIGYDAIRQDITNKKLVEELSITDSLTKLYNRRHFDDIFDKSINKAKRDRNIFCLLFLDVDNFKKYNDTYGHQMGDNVLFNIARILKENMKRATDIAFRMGGEEFSAIYSVEDEKSAFAFADKIRQCIENDKIEHKTNSASLFVTASFGVIFVNFEKNNSMIVDKSVLYKLADDLLYKVKESGRNRVIVEEFN